MPSLLILTVGTGTDSRRGNLAAGLARTISLVKPRLYWLVPSALEDSQLIADIVREEVADDSIFCSWTDDSPYCIIADPDELEVCRDMVRRVIRTAREALIRGETLVVNATSGTKQMSAGATLAALDEGLGRVDFTVGQREGGIVISGTERIQSFDAGRFFAERALREAAALYDAGSLAAAAKLLELHLERGFADVRQAHEIAQCADEWQRLRFSQARQIASRGTSPLLIPLRAPLTRLAEAQETSPVIMRELLAGARRCLAWREPEEALARAYRAAELMAKCRLAAAHHLVEPYSLEDFQQALPSRSQQFQALARDGVLLLGLRQSFDVLAALGDPLAAEFFSVGLFGRLALRNETLFGHGTTSVPGVEVSWILDELGRLASEHLQTGRAEPFPPRLFS
jgi:hypothetical protein